MGQLTEGKLYLAAYDIPYSKGGNRRRRKLYKLLSEYGRRVQYSVFELRLRNQKAKIQLMEKSQKFLDSEEDSFRMYPVAENPENMLIIGKGEILTIEKTYVV